MTPAELTLHMFLQLAVIVCACRVVGVAARWCGQPQVVGEMVTGVLLGPSLWGWYWPEAQQWLFPVESRPLLLALSQLGLTLYMFVVGMEFRADLFRQRAVTALSVSVAGMVVPFALGCLVALGLLASPGAGDALAGHAVSRRVNGDHGVSHALAHYRGAGAVGDRTRDFGPLRGSARRCGGVVPAGDGAREF
jgi:Kef-type K+ transport system membrane component KefB